MGISELHPYEAVADFVCDACGQEETLTLRESIKRERSEYVIPCPVEDCIGLLEQQGAWRDDSSNSTEGE